MIYSFISGIFWLALFLSTNLVFNSHIFYLDFFVLLFGSVMQGICSTFSKRLLTAHYQTFSQGWSKNTHTHSTSTHFIYLSINLHVLISLLSLSSSCHCVLVMAALRHSRLIVALFGAISRPRTSTHAQYSMSLARSFDTGHTNCTDVLWQQM